MPSLFVAPQQHQQMTYLIGDLPFHSLWKHFTLYWVAGASPSILVWLCCWLLQLRFSLLGYKVFSRFVSDFLCFFLFFYCLLVTLNVMRNLWVLWIVNIMYVHSEFLAFSQWHEASTLAFMNNCFPECLSLHQQWQVVELKFKSILPLSVLIHMLGYGGSSLVLLNNFGILTVQSQHHKGMGSC